MLGGGAFRAEECLAFGGTVLMFGDKWPDSPRQLADIKKIASRRLVCQPEGGKLVAGLDT